MQQSQNESKISHSLAGQYFYIPGEENGPANNISGDQYI